MLLPKRTAYKDVILVVVLGLICLGLMFIPTGFETSMPKNSHFARARVLEVDNSDIHQALIVKTGVQELNVELLEGPFKGQTYNASNNLTGKMEMDEVYTKNREVLVEYSVINGRTYLH